MTQIHGVYCDKCRRRYVYHVCKNGLPCRHECAQVTRSGDILAPATIIECYAWIRPESYREFYLAEIRAVYRDGKTIIETVEDQVFCVKNIDPEDVKKKFLEFLLEKVDVHKWPAWVGAFKSLWYGGPGAVLPPMWRLRELSREERRQDSRPSPPSPRTS